MQGQGLHGQSFCLILAFFAVSFYCGASQTSGWSQFQFTDLNECRSSFSSSYADHRAPLTFLRVIGKSAQVPLHVWLIDAMEGPTPVSALIHAATMVAAGIYLLAAPFLFLPPSTTALTFIAYTGASPL